MIFNSLDECERRSGRREDEKKMLSSISLSAIIIADLIKLKSPCPFNPQIIIFNKKELGWEKKMSSLRVQLLKLVFVN
jgi:hypothetical protein